MRTQAKPHHPCWFLPCPQSQALPCPWLTPCIVPVAQILRRAQHSSERHAARCAGGAAGAEEPMDLRRGRLDLDPAPEKSICPHCLQPEPEERRSLAWTPVAHAACGAAGTCLLLPAMLSGARQMAAAQSPSSAGCKLPRPEPTAGHAQAVGPLSTHSMPGKQCFSGPLWFFKDRA